MGECSSIMSEAPVVTYFKCTCLMLKLNPKQYWPNTQPADLLYVLNVTAWDGALPPTVITPSNVAVETGASTSALGVVDRGGEGRGRHMRACTGSNDW